MIFKGSVNNSKVTAEVYVSSHLFGQLLAKVNLTFEGGGDGVKVALLPPQITWNAAWEHAKQCMKILGFEEVQ